MGHFQFNKTHHMNANGSGAPKGNKNAYKYGHYTREAIEKRLFLRRLIKSCNRFCEEISDQTELFMFLKKYSKI